MATSDIRPRRRPDELSAEKQSAITHPWQRSTLSGNIRIDMYRVRNRQEREQGRGREPPSDLSPRREDSNPPIITEEQWNDPENGRPWRSKPDEAGRDSSSKRGRVDAGEVKPGEPHRVFGRFAQH